MIFKSTLPILFPPPDFITHLKTIKKFLLKDNKGILITNKYTVGIDTNKGVLYKGIKLNKQNDPNMSLHIPCSEFKRRYSPKIKDIPLEITSERILFKSGRFLQFDHNPFPDFTALKKPKNFIPGKDLKKYLVKVIKEINYYSINSVNIYLNQKILNDLFLLYPYNFDIYYEEKGNIFFINNQLTIAVAQVNV